MHVIRSIANIRKLRDEGNISAKLAECIFRSLNTALPAKTGQLNGGIRPDLRLRKPAAFFNKSLL